MSFDDPDRFADSSSAAPPSFPMSSHGLSQLTIPSSPAYLLPPRDVVSRHLSFPREFAALAHSRSALAPSTLPKDLPDAVVSQPLPPPGNNPLAHTCSCGMSDWEVELCNHYHQTLVDSIARRQDATAKAEAMLAEVEREIQRHEAYIAYELNATAIEEQRLLERSYLIRQGIATANSEKEGHVWNVDNVQLRTSLPPKLRGYTGAKNSYQQFLQEISQRRKVTIEPRVITTMPVPFASVNHLQQYLRETNGDENKHGHIFANDWLIPLKDHALLVSTDDSAMTLHNSIQSGTSNDRTLEVIVKSWGEKRFAYLGSFKPKSWWLPFTRTVTGELPELFEGWTKSKDDNCLYQFQHLRVHWHNAKNNLVFCVLEFSGFNQFFYNKLDQLTTDLSGMDCGL